VSILGVGIDFNSELADSITKNEGSNYFCIVKEKDMKEVLIDHFHYNFFPAALNCLLRIESDSYEVVRTYGIIYINSIAHYEVPCRLVIIYIYFIKFKGSPFDDIFMDNPSEDVL